MTDLKTLVQAAEDIAKIGGAHTLKYFKKDFEVISKADDSPVTIADRETEMIIRNEIEKLTRNWRMSGEGWGDLSVTVIHSDKDALMDLRDDIYHKFGGDSYIYFDDEEE